MVPCLLLHLCQNQYCRVHVHSCNKAFNFPCTSSLYINCLKTSYLNATSFYINTWLFHHSLPCPFFSLTKFQTCNANINYPSKSSMYISSKGIYINRNHCSKSAAPLAIRCMLCSPLEWSTYTHAMLHFPAACVVSSYLQFHAQGFAHIPSFSKKL